jgi:hypothetical protein
VKQGVQELKDPHTHLQHVVVVTASARIKKNTTRGASSAAAVGFSPCVSAAGRSCRLLHHNPPPRRKRSFGASNLRTGRYVCRLDARRRCDGTAQGVAVVACRPVVSLPPPCPPAVGTSVIRSSPSPFGSNVCARCIIFVVISHTTVGTPPSSSSSSLPYRACCFLPCPQLAEVCKGEHNTEIDRQPFGLPPICYPFLEGSPLRGLDNSPNLVR